MGSEAAEEFEALLKDLKERAGSTELVSEFRALVAELREKRSSGR